MSLDILFHTTSFYDNTSEIQQSTCSILIPLSVCLASVLSIWFSWHWSILHCLLIPVAFSPLSPHLWDLNVECGMGHHTLKTTIPYPLHHFMTSFTIHKHWNCVLPHWHQTMEGYGCCAEETNYLCIQAARLRGTQYICL